MEQNKSRLLHSFKNHDEVHLEKKQIKAISTNINYFSSTVITQTSCSPTFPKTNQYISNIHRGHHAECHLEDTCARRENELGMEEGGTSAGVTVIVRGGGELGQVTTSNVGLLLPLGYEVWNI